MPKKCTGTNYNALTAAVKKSISLVDPMGAQPVRDPKGPDSLVLTYKFFETQACQE